MTAMRGPASQHRPSADCEAVIAQVADEIARKCQAGEAVDLRAYIERYPQFEEQILRILPVMRSLVDLGLSVTGGPSAGSSHPAQQLLEGTLGDFRICREIGRGGMGMVYEAQQLSLGRRVALKILPFAAILDPRQLQRFQNEAQAAACLHHQNIVPVYSIGCERGIHYYAMQFIEGQTLAQLIDRLRQIVYRPTRGEETTSGADCNLRSGQPGLGEQEPPGEKAATEVAAAAPDDTQPILHAAISTEGSIQGREFFRSVARLGIQAAEALEHAHQTGVVHRDIKPSNLMVDARGHLWITDFGLAMTQTSAEPDDDRRPGGHAPLHEPRAGPGEPREFSTTAATSTPWA